MRAWADRPKDWNGNRFVLGDFNLDRIGDPLFEAFIATGLCLRANSAECRAPSSTTTALSISMTRSPDSRSRKATAC